MSEPRVEQAEAVVRRLLAEASELDWAGEHARAERLRRKAEAIRSRGDAWVANF